MKKYLKGLLLLTSLSILLAIGLIFGCSHLENKKKLTKAEKECIKYQVDKFCIPKKRKCNKEKHICDEKFEKCQQKHIEKCKEVSK